MRSFSSFLFLLAPLFVFAQPQIEFDRTNVDLGKVQFGGWANATFVFTNKGDKPLCILNVACNGGCTEHHYSSDPVMPDARNRIEVKCNSSIVGKFEHILKVTTNASLQPLELKVSGEILSYDNLLRIDQGIVDLGEIKYGEEKFAYVKFHLDKRQDNFSFTGMVYDTITCSIAASMEDFNKGKGGMYYSDWGGRPDSGYIRISAKNLQGNSGDFEKKLSFRISYNINITPLIVKGRFVDDRKSRIDITKFGKSGHTDRYFTNGHPDSIRFFDYYGKLSKVRYFTKGLSYRDKTLFTPGPLMLFRSLVHDYGRIEKGSDGNCEFWFINGGDEPLVISNCNTSCGCLVPEWPKEPIKPGDSARIRLRYDTQRIGPFEKTATVTTNADPQTVVLRIKGHVYPAFTTMSLEKDTVDLGRIGFGDTSAVQLRFFNTGSHKLEIYSSSNIMDGLLECSCEMDISRTDYKDGYRDIDLHSDNGTICIKMCNYYGEVGHCVRKIRLESNTSDERSIIVKCEFTGGPGKDFIQVPGQFNQQQIFNYAGNKLDSVAVYDSQGKLSETRSYKWGVKDEVKIRRYFNDKNFSVRIFRGGELKEEKYY